MRPSLFIHVLLATAALCPGAEPVSSELSRTDSFAKAIKWENAFDPAAATAEPVRCLMRIQHRMNGDPLDWVPAVMVYRLSPRDPLLLRISQPGGTSNDERTEYDYTSTKPISGGKHTFTLEITASLSKDQGRLRLLMDDVPITWKELKVTSFPSKQVVLEKKMTGNVIAGDTPTLFSAPGRWIANGDPSDGLFSYQLLAISPL